jgi:hypothetical protein
MRVVLIRQLVSLAAVVGLGRLEEVGKLEVPQL